MKKKSTGGGIVRGQAVANSDLTVAFVLKGWVERKIWEILVDLLLITCAVRDH